MTKPKMSKNLWDQPERYIVIQAHNTLYPAIPSAIKCKHRWLHERILVIRKDFPNLFQSDKFGETMQTHLISNMLTQWRASMTSTATAKYISFPVRARIVFSRDAGMADEDIVMSIFTDGVDLDVHYKKSTLNPGERQLVTSMMTRELSSRLAELYNGDTAEGPLRFYCEVASMFRQLVTDKLIRKTVLLWKFEEAVVDVMNTVKDKSKRQREEFTAVMFPVPKMVHN